MKQRGRPRHPDVLTPREWEVLSLIREGLSNPEIGQRLGISADAAKYHVSEILSKLGVPTREEAAAWQPGPAEARVMRPAWARALARWWPALAWAGAVVVLAGLGLLAWGLLRSNDDDGGLVEGSGTPTVTGSPAESVTASPGGDVPAFLARVPISPLTIGEDLAFPTDRAFIMLLGCTACDGPAGGIGRYYTDASGDVQFDRLLWAVPGSAETPSNNLGLPQDGDYAVFGAASDFRGRDIIAAVWSAPQTIFFRSTDGGVTWARYASLDGAPDLRVALRGPSTCRYIRVRADCPLSQYS